jgi:hypothetical protein
VPEEVIRFDAITTDEGPWESRRKKENRTQYAPRPVSTTATVRNRM